MGGTYSKVNQKKQLYIFVVCLTNMYKKSGPFSKRELVRCADHTSNFPGGKLFWETDQFRRSHDNYHVPVKFLAAAEKYLKAIFLLTSTPKGDILDSYKR